VSRPLSSGPGRPGTTPLKPVLQRSKPGDPRRPRADEAGDIDWLVQIDSTIVRAHQHAAATGRKGGSTGRTNRTITPSADPEEA
jgi:hypothetical protein